MAKNPFMHYISDFEKEQRISFANMNAPMQ